jgi:hypothetical protein
MIGTGASSPLAGEGVAMQLHASVGDGIVVDAVHRGEPPRQGEVIEVIGTGDAEHFRVRWDDGHVSLLFPGATTRIVPFNHSGPAQSVSH